MSDITKCKGKNCPKDLRLDCLRFTAKESSWQSWIMGKVNRKTYKCDDYLSSNKITTSKGRY